MTPLEVIVYGGIAAVCGVLFLWAWWSERPCKHEWREPSIDPFWHIRFTTCVRCKEVRILGADR